MEKKRTVLATQVIGTRFEIAEFASSNSPFNHDNFGDREKTMTSKIKQTGIRNWFKPVKTLALTAIAVCISAHTLAVGEPEKEARFQVITAI